MVQQTTNYLTDRKQEIIVVLNIALISFMTDYCHTAVTHFVN